MRLKRLDNMEFETVCGIEVHTELSTKTKIFCSCKTDFGGDVNSHCCEVCTGMPGTLPVLNKKVLEYAVKCAVALNCEVNLLSKFDRKNYFYPDLPKAYQISQLYLPFCKNGYVEISGGKKIRIHEIHMEEDAGKLVHENKKSYVNYNRAGVPLLEIVSEPDLSNGTEAAEYVRKLRSILMSIGISDCKMQEGSLRADVNVSVREKGSDELKTRTEMKNLSSFKAIKTAVDTEAKRQIDVIKSGKKVELQTRRWDEKENKSYVMRTKETADDYRYFPEPDLPPVKLDIDYINEVKANLPELPDEKKKRLMSLGLTEYDAVLITESIEYAVLFDKVNALTNLPKECANYILGEVTMLKKETGKTAQAKAIAQIINLVNENKITRETAKSALRESVENDASPIEYIKRNNLEIKDDRETVLTVCREVIENSEKAVSEYKSGKEKALGYLIGQSMKKLRGTASPELVRKTIINELKLR